MATYRFRVSPETWALLSVQRELIRSTLNWDSGGTAGPSSPSSMVRRGMGVGSPMKSRVSSAIPPIVPSTPTGTGPTGVIPVVLSGPDVMGMFSTVIDTDCMVVLRQLIHTDSSMVCSTSVV